MLIKRASDVQDILRKLVFEFFLSLDAAETQVALATPAVLDTAFTALRDQDSSIARVGLQIVSHLMAKATGDAGLLKLVSARLAKEKHQILKMAIPSDSNDAPTIQRAL